MKEDEIKFFTICYKYRNFKNLTIRDIINIISPFINYKRCWYYLKKWDLLGFYNYGITEDLGWFELEKLPQRYKKLIDEIKQ